MIRLILATVLILLSGCAVHAQEDNEPPPTPPVACGYDVNCTGKVDAADIGLVRQAFLTTYRSCRQINDADPGDTLIIEGYGASDVPLTITVEGHGSQQVTTAPNGWWRVSFTAIEGGPYSVSDGMPLCVADVLPVVP